MHRSPLQSPIVRSGIGDRDCRRAQSRGGTSSRPRMTDLKARSSKLHRFVEIAP
jgi:hypothetical protein